MRAADKAPAEENVAEENVTHENATAHANDEIAITVATMQIGVPARIKALPMPSDVIPRTAPWPRFEMPAARGAIAKPQRWWPMPTPSPVAPRPFAIVRDAAWAFAATASLAVAGSVASALVYAIVFP
jgi:hypothetical protein